MRRIAYLHLFTILLTAGCGPRDDDEKSCAAGSKTDPATYGSEEYRPPSGPLVFPKDGSDVNDALFLRAARIKRMNNLKQIGLAMHYYLETHNEFPPARTAKEHFDVNGSPKLSWRVHILPFLEEERLYRQFKLDEPWDSEHNLRLSSQMPTVYRTGTSLDRTSVMTFTGKGAGFEQGKSTQFPIQDGASNTILFVEAAPGRAVLWTKPEDLPFNPPNDPWQAIGYLRDDYVLAAMFDGSVKPIRKRVDKHVLRALITRSGGEIVQGFPN